MFRCCVQFLCRHGMDVTMARMRMILKVEIPCGSNPEITVAKYFMTFLMYQHTSQFQLRVNILGQMCIPYPSHLLILL